MDQKLLFNDALVSLVEYASAQGNQLSKQEIQNHFKELTLDDNQYELIYSYLAANKITVEGFEETENNAFSEAPVTPDESETSESLEIPEETSPLKESQEELSFIDMYLKELEAIPPADADEKATLLQKLSVGNQDVVNRLVELHLNLVAEAAQKKRGKGVTFGDLIQEGNMGLIQAISEFHESEESFDAYLEKAIDAALDQAISNQVSSDRIGQHLANKLNQLDKATKDLSEKLGRVPEISELAEEMGITEEETSLLLKTSLDTLSVNEDTQITEPEQTEPAPKEDPLTWRVNR
ncbi:MAG: sigma-70 family RNA polymerase sigma factor [Eubacterium sp.]|nr:sigma-70 family RNA polymerase sigma factor [Eubacterium sp.]